MAERLYPFCGTSTMKNIIKLIEASGLFFVALALMLGVALAAAIVMRGLQ